MKLVVIRDESASRSEEESVEKFGSSESKEIDFLMDFIEKESKAHRSPLKPLRVVRRKKPSTELATQPSHRDERVQGPKLAKEYHVHYHSHQHKAVENPSLSVNEDKIAPILLDTLSSHLNTFHNIYVPPRTPQLPVIIPPVIDRFKDFKDFESLLSKQKNPEPKGKYVFQEEIEDTFHEPANPIYNKTIQEKKLAMLKKYQALLNARSQTHKVRDDFLNRDRFAGFTDFSSIESFPPKASSPEIESPRNADKGVIIKDFAIVIKTKNPSSNQQTKYNSAEHSMSYQKPISHPIRPRVPHETQVRHALRLPRILDAPGGAPQFLEKLNRIKLAKITGNVALRHTAPQKLHSIESQNRQKFVLEPVPRPNASKNVYNGWVIQKIAR
ncbi:uncharacterized protein TNCT_37571 [Trichonephila clavata]|uniref:Uncharacterized protein n=1 Tax=Trichonephila clavata TaxID=2740835 RepID=A0A8X6LZG1_TRICU|nr:uncharacterized protein TNCT_37571 [Trichonephila clavata]